MQKLYCYVDETGLDTEGRLFVVAVVVTGQNKDDLLQLCEDMERDSGKGKFKWGKAAYSLRMAYLRQVLAERRLEGALRYAMFFSTHDYEAATVATIARAISWKRPVEPFTTMVYVDGLSKSKRREYSRALHRLGIPTRQVRGVGRDENNALVRLADAVAGFVRDALDRDTPEVVALFERCKKRGWLIEV
jgi:hypothetical protein